MDELSSNDYVVVDHFLDIHKLKTIQTFFLSHLQIFNKAGIGALGDHVIREDIRGDYIYGWIEKETPN
jgi:SM-20-related protein